MQEGRCFHQPDPDSRISCVKVEQAGANIRVPKKKVAFSCMILSVPTFTKPLTPVPFRTPTHQPLQHRSKMTIRMLSTTVRRTLVSAASAPRSAVLPQQTLRSLSTTFPLRSSSNSSASRPDPKQADQGATGPTQSSLNASGPSGTVRDSNLSDPYPLPFSPDIVDLNNADSGPESGPESKWAGLNLASERQNLDGVDAPMRVPGREGEDREGKIARLVYQCRKRGTLETDLILSTFAKKELKELPNEELDELDRVSTPSPLCHFSVARDNV